MVIMVELENYAVKKVLTDQGSSVDIHYWVTYQKLQLPTTAMVSYDEPIYSLSGRRFPPTAALTFIPSFAMTLKPRQSLSVSLS